MVCIGRRVFCSRYDIFKDIIGDLASGCHTREAKPTRLISPIATIILKGVVIDEDWSKACPYTGLEADQPASRVVDDVPVEGKIHCTETIFKKETVVGRLKDFVIAPSNILVRGIRVQNVFMLLTIIVRVIDEGVLDDTVIPTTTPERLSYTMNAHVIEEHVGSVDSMAERHNIYTINAAIGAGGVRYTSRTVNFNVLEAYMINRLAHSASSSFTTTNTISTCSWNQNLNTVSHSTIYRDVSRRSRDINLGNNYRTIVRGIPSFCGCRNFISGQHTIDSKRIFCCAEGVSLERGEINSTRDPNRVSTA